MFLALDAFFERRFEADRLPVLLKQVGERFVGQFLKAVAAGSRDGFNRSQRSIIELNAFTRHGRHRYKSHPVF